ncbi:MAG: PAS domain S-box protein [candidate division Zixibacteria bacterium]|nr:PAS domain S-box protein [Candidatus Tariuqbacter arcticus]
MKKQAEQQEDKFRIGIIAILLVCGCFLLYYFHIALETGVIVSHFFYIPIILAAIWWKRRGLIVAGLSAALLIFSHNFLRLEAAAANDYARALMFIVIASVVVVSSERLARTREKLRETDEYLEKSKAYTESIIKNFLDTLIAVDLKANITTVNPATCRLLGYTEEELIGQSVSIIFAEEEEEEVNRMFLFFREPENAKPLRPRDTIRNCELNYRTKDGRLIPMSFNASVLTDGAGNITGVVSGAKDITDIKRAEEARINAERHIKEVVENIFKFVPEGLLVFSDRLNLLKENKAFKDIVQKYAVKLDYTEEELARLIIEQVKNKITDEDYSEIRIPRKRV